MLPTVLLFAGLISAGADGSAARADSAHDGVAVRLYDTLQTAMNKIAGQAGTTATADTDTQSYLGRLLHTYEKRISTMEDQLKQAEDRYYKQFDAMEQAISLLNRQSQWLTQQFSTGQSS